MIGTFGSLVFECSDSQILTFQELSFTRSANYAEHKIIGSNTLLEFTGHNVSTGSLKMTFDEALGIEPLVQLKELQRMLQEHEACNFVLDGQPVGSGCWVIESLNDTWELLDNNGRPRRITANVSLKEYR